MTLKHRLTTVALSLCTWASAAFGAPLDLVSQKPDIYSSYITIDYNATSDLFSATGLARKYYTPDAYTITNGSFGLSATIDANGVATSGSLTINGATAGGSGSGSYETLLTGSLARFGFSPDASLGDTPKYPRFEFIFDITGGSLAPDYRRFGPQLGVILNGMSNFSGTFTVNYTNNYATSDTFVTPEPGSACAMLASAFTVIVGRLRRRARTRRRTQGEAGRA